MTEATPRKANVWVWPARFPSLGKPYLGRIVLTILVCLVASGAKAMQSFLLAPLIDNARRNAGADPGTAILSKAPTWWGQFLQPATWDSTFIATLALATAALM